MGLRRRLEHGYGMRVERTVQGLLLLAALVFDDLRPAYIAFLLLALQVVLSPLASPFAVAYAVLDRTERPHRLGDVYYDMAGIRGAASIACAVTGTAFLLIRHDVPIVGQILLGVTCASCLLAATIGFCAGCGHYVMGRDLIVHRSPEGTADVQLSDVDQQQVSASP